MSKTHCLKCGKVYHYHFMDVPDIEHVTKYCGDCRLLNAKSDKNG